MANILVIDDEPILLELISTSLKKDGHNVTAISDPLAASDFIPGGETVFGLVVTDVEMRPISGPEVVKRLINKGWTGPVLFMSGYSSSSGVIASSQDENLMIEKPFTAGELRSAVARALTRGRSKSSHVA